MCNEVNGWPNYETWNIALWLTNDQSDYEMTQEWLADLDDPYDSHAAYELSKVIKEYVEDNNPLLDDASMYSDMLSAAISTCDFYRIAERWIEDYIAENPPVGTKNNPAEYKIEPEIPGFDNTWCAYDSELDEINLYVESIDTFWDAFENCIQHAVDNEYKSIVIEWLITQSDVRWHNDHKTDRLIAKQASRSIRKDA